MNITDIQSGMLVQYVGKAPGLVGLRGAVGRVGRVFFNDVEVFFDGRIKPIYVRPQLLRRRLVVGGVTTTRREVLMNHANEDERTPPSSERGAGLKFDGGKEQPRLLHQGMPLALAEVVRTLTFGARKYAAHSWQHVENGQDRYQDASYRHDAARCRGELFDPETGIRHRAHHIINELFLLELELREEQARGAE